MIDEIDLRLVTNLKDLMTITDETMPFNYAVILGNPDYSNGGQSSYGYSITLDSLTSMGIPQLPGTKKEVVEISSILDKDGWRVDAFTEHDASEQRLKSMIKPKVLHIASHGYFQPNTEKNFNLKSPLYRSGLLLSGAGNTHNYKEDITLNAQQGNEDGVLTAFEAMNLNIENTDLVVLSACETGLGEIQNGEGVYGLQRAFIVAGAKSLIISLWQVNDEVTQELMIDFYRNWLNGHSKRKAFIETQRLIKSKYPSPYYWGAFVFVGV